MKNWRARHLNYFRDEGVDFVGRFNKKYIAGEANFLTDFGGHQNAQFAGVISTITSESVKAITIAVLDGVLYIKTNNKMYSDSTTTYSNCNILSALLLREFLYSI